MDSGRFAGSDPGILMRATGQKPRMKPRFKDRHARLAISSMHNRMHFIRPGLSEQYKVHIGFKG